MIIDESTLSPGMKQYMAIKRQYEDAILFYRLGDFYEMFFEDAITVSRVLDLVLTSKNCGNEQRAPMCGIPYHASQTYLAKLLAEGYKVAICEQLSSPTAGKMVDRDVVRVITPGTVTDEEMLDGSKNNYLLSIFKRGEKIGVCYADVSTGDCECVNITSNLEQEMSNILARVNPSEVIGNGEGKLFYDNLIVVRNSGLVKLEEYYDWAFDKERAKDNLSRQFGENYENVYELKGKSETISAVSGLLEYLKETQKQRISNISSIKLVKNSKYMIIDSFARRNLEIVESNRDRKKFGSILWVLDKTKTSMGARKLRKMIDEPLQSSKEINDRLDGVEELVKKLIMRDNIAQLLSKIYDIERLSGKIGFKTITPKDMVTLRMSLEVLPFIRKELESVTSPLLKDCREGLVNVDEITSILNKAIDDEATTLLKGNFIKKGFNKELDEYRSAHFQGNNWVKELEAREIEETGIKSLKIKFNKVFGYFIEVNKKDIDRVPLRYIRKQTVSNNERYITEDLKVIEEKVLGAEERASTLENEIYSQIVEMLSKYILSFQQIAKSIAYLDALLSLSVVAVKNNYTRPAISQSQKELKIIGGRHPVVENFISSGSFIENDTLLDEDENKIMVLTGPNMAGKSTYMRQVAIITLLAHIGSFVPAKEARIPITDRIFTRVGASDDLAFGQSTFMVEMSEVASILAGATDKSLIILDEIGRGTSTFDGLSIAWSVVEYLSKNKKSKTLFATHYHELTELEGVLDGVKNYKIAVKEVDDNVVFLRKIVRGGANKSFGVEVARLAGVPSEVIERAKEISSNLEQVNQKLDLNIFKENKDRAKDNTKLALAILNSLKDIDMTRVSPMHAFDLLNDFVERAKEEK